MAPTSEVQAHFVGGLKIVYDLALYRSFNKNKPPEEHKAACASRTWEVGAHDSMR